MRISHALSVILLLMMLSVSCLRETEDLSSSLVDLSDVRIYNYFEYDNGDQLFFVKPGNTLTNTYNAAIVYKKGNDIRLFNNDFNKINSPQTMYTFTEGGYIYSDESMFGGVYYYKFNLDAYKVIESRSPLCRISNFDHEIFDPVSRKHVFIKDTMSAVKLYRFDGESFTEKSIPIPPNFINYPIAIDPVDGYWVGGDYLKHYHGGTVDTYESIATNSINNICFDKNNNLWCLKNQKILKWERGQGQALVIDESNSSIPQSTKFFQLCIGDDDMIWLRTSYDQIYRYDPTQDDFTLIYNDIATMLIGKSYSAPYLLIDHKLYKVENTNLVEIKIQ